MIKVSDDDLTWLFPGQPFEEIAKRWVADGAAVVVVTRGVNGSIGYTESGVEEAHGVKIDLADTVGAGDMVVAGFSAARATGASIQEACEFASLAVHISIHQIGETGSASPDAIRQLHHGHSIA